MPNIRAGKDLVIKRLKNSNISEYNRLIYNIILTIMLCYTTDMMIKNLAVTRDEKFLSSQTIS